MLDRNYLYVTPATQEGLEISLYDATEYYSYESYRPYPIVKYSLDEGATWNDYTIGRDGEEQIVSLAYGEKCYFHGLSDYFSAYVNPDPLDIEDYLIRFWVKSGSANFGGEVDSLINWNPLSTGCFMELFSYQDIVTPPELPATTLAEECYYNMFEHCTLLTKAPELPATTLANSCYLNMFAQCESLLYPPELPATTLANSCYMYMFSGCTSLRYPPELPATTLPNQCYWGMFYGCRSIKLSVTESSTYITPYRIPKNGTGTIGSGSLTYMFYNTGGTMATTPSINTTYYGDWVVVKETEPYRISDLFKALAKIDYILERGVSGIWTYEKWSDGTYKCWTRQSFSVSFRAWGNVFESTSSLKYSYPITFVDIPYVQYSVETTNRECWTSSWQSGTVSSTPEVMVNSASSANASGYINFYAVGKWK